jgi:hypothetical protein
MPKQNDPSTWPPIPNQPEPPQPCVVKVPVPAGTVNLLDPEVIAKEITRGEAENAEEGK